MRGALRHVGVIIVSALFSTLAAAEATPVADGPSRITAQVVLKVANKDEAQAMVVSEVERLGGYFSHLSEGQVTVRVPVGKTDALLTYMDGLGLVADRQYRSEDLREGLANQKTRLGARKKVLEQYFKLLNTANSKAVITVEREITRLVAEVERYEGGIRLLEHDAKLAKVTVRFQFRDRTQPTQKRRSSFDWLNTLSLSSLVKSGANVRDIRLPKNRVRVRSPEGFAAYETKRQHWSASPDGVLFRVRSMQHEPQADLAFWSESMEKQLESDGYRVHAKSDVSAGQVPGRLIETHAPMGPHDYAYTIALFPAGKRLVVVEVAGPVEKYQNRREAVLKAIGALEF